jgi:hypothetical protein
LGHVNARRVLQVHGHKVSSANTRFLVLCGRLRALIAIANPAKPTPLENITENCNWHGFCVERTSYRKRPRNEGYEIVEAVRYRNSLSSFS